MENQIQTLTLWPEGIPQSRIAPDYLEAVVRPWGADCLSRVSQPRLLFCPACDQPETLPSILVCPGGGYEVISYLNEGYEVAAWLNHLGFNAAILFYRLPSSSIMDDPSLGPLLDVREGMRALRKHLSKPGVTQQPCGVMGFSAGGHLAASLSVHWDKDLKVPDHSVVPEISCRPDFSLLIYPVIHMQPELGHAGSTFRLLGSNPAPQQIEWFSAQAQVRSDTPPAFLVHSTNDGAVNWRNSLAYFEACQDQGVAAEMHLYPDGGHGYGLAGAAREDFNPVQKGQRSFCTWTVACETWLRSRGL